MNLAELRFWELQNNWGETKRGKFEELLSDFGVIQSDEELCRIWAGIKSDAKKKGRPIDTG